MASIQHLLDEFRAAFVAGEEPAAGEFLDRADESERQELEAAIDRYLMEAPRQRWDPTAYEESRAHQAVERVFESIEGSSGSWPALLPRLRNRARITRGEVVWRLSAALGVSDQERVADYVNRMEHGKLPAAGVSNRVIEALAGILGTSADLLRSAGSGEIAPGDAPIFARAATLAEEFDAPLPTAPAGHAPPDPGDTEKVDRLFTGGP